MMIMYLRLCRRLTNCWHWNCLKKRFCFPLWKFHSNTVHFVFTLKFPRIFVFYCFLVFCLLVFWLSGPTRDSYGSSASLIQRFGLAAAGLQLESCAVHWTSLTWAPRVTRLPGKLAPDKKHLFIPVLLEDPLHIKPRRGTTSFRSGFLLIEWDIFICDGSFTFEIVSHFCLKTYIFFVLFLNQVLTLGLMGMAV